MRRSARLLAALTLAAFCAAQAPAVHAQNQPEASAAARVKHRPAKPRTSTKAQPGKSEPGKAESGKASPAKPEAAKSEPAKLEPAAPQEAPVPYEPALLRLSEIMGALAYLRDLCGVRDGEDWRSRMGALIDAEGTTEARRERLAGAFNRGFRGYQTTYRACTGNARQVISRYIDEGSRIARDVTSRYGGG